MSDDGPPSPHLQDRRPSRLYSAKLSKLQCVTAALRQSRTVCLASFLYSGESGGWVVGYRPTHHEQHLSFYVVWNCPLSCRSFGFVAPQDVNPERQLTETSNSAFSVLSTFKGNIISCQHTSLPQAIYGYT